MAEAARLLGAGERATVEQIARAAKTSRTTFYRSFPSRADLVTALKLEPEVDTGRRILEAAARLLQQQPLSQLSMDELASVAGVSRANLYRLFPGKGALFRGMLIAFSPFEPVMRFLDANDNRPPEEMIPALVLTAYHAVAARAGIARTLIFEVTSPTDDARQAFGETGLQVIARLVAYLGKQMEAGRLRRIHPLLALQALIAPVMMLVLSGGLLGSTGIERPGGDQAVSQLASLWLKGMAPG